MLLIKLYYHICAALSSIGYKILYGSRLSVGKGTTWRRSLSVMIAKDGRVKVGKGCFFNNYCSLNANESIEIGDNCIFGENVKIYDHNHRFASFDEPIKHQGFSQSAVEIGENCWVGSNVTILKGARIGRHCVIGAGCTVSGNIPDHTVVKRAEGVVLEEIRRDS